MAGSDIVVEKSEHRILKWIFKLLNASLKSVKGSMIF